MEAGQRGGAAGVRTRQGQTHEHTHTRGVLFQTWSLQRDVNVFSGYREVCGGGHGGGARSHRTLSTPAARHRGPAHERHEDRRRSVRSREDVLTSGHSQTLTHIEEPKMWSQLLASVTAINASMKSL